MSKFKGNFQFLSFLRVSIGGGGINDYYFGFSKVKANG